jgi:serine phosphatase RsbU (regulator of sigma subunit)
MRLDASRGELRYANAGHNPPLLARTNGEVEALRSSGTVLGVFPEAEYAGAATALHRGDRLLLYTDGLVERRGDDIDAAIDRTAAALAAAPANQPLPALLEQLAAEIADPSAADDMVLLAARIPAGRA